jgi:hypothetical protein
MVGGAVAGARRALPRWQALSSCRRGVSLASKEVQPKAGVPQMPLFDFTPQPYNGPKADEILAKRKKFLNPALFLYYKKHVSSAQLPHLWSIQCLFFVKKSSTTTFPIRHCNVVWCFLPD